MDPAYLTGLAIFAGSAVGERKIPRDVNGAARDKARTLAGPEAFQRSCNERRKSRDARLAHLKTRHGFDRLRLRGLTGARDEFASRMAWRRHQKRLHQPK